MLQNALREGQEGGDGESERQGRGKGVGGVRGRDREIAIERCAGIHFLESQREF